MGISYLLNKGKKLLVMGMVILLAISLFGCADSNDSSGEKGSDDSSSKESSQDNKVEKDEKIILKYADVVSTSDPQYMAAELFAEKISEKTNGQVEVQVFPNSQLGSTKEVTEGLNLGTVEIVKTANAFFTGFLPETKLLDLPYLFKDREHARKALDGEIGEYLKAAAEERGYKILWYFTPRARSLYNTQRPINNPDDMQGLKVRVMDSPIMIDAINTMGGNAVPLPFGEVYSALEQGVIDGAENSIISFSAMKHSEVAKYFSSTNHFYSPELVVMSLGYYNSLSENLRKSIEETAHEVVEYEAKIYDEQVVTLTEQLIEQGIEFNEVDLDAFREKMIPLFEKHADEVGGMDIINKTLNY